MIYRHSGGAFFVRGSILDAYAGLGWEQSVLGYPVSDEICGIRDGGCYQNFQNGAIVWSPATGAQPSYGPIRAKWATLDYERGWLGYPTSAPRCSLPGGGCSQAFQGGVIVWSSGSGAHFMRGEIRKTYDGRGGPGVLGYPTTDEICGLSRGGCRQELSRERAALYWSPASGTFTVQGLIRDHWKANGAEAGVFGYPVSFEQAMNGGITQYFEKGFIHYDPATGSVYGAFQ